MFFSTAGIAVLDQAGRGIAHQPAGGVADEIRDVGGAGGGQQGLQQLDAQTQQERSAHGPEKAVPAPHQRPEKAEGDGHQHIEQQLPHRVPVAQPQVAERF